MTINSISILDISQTSEAAVERIQSIGSVSVIMVSPQTRHLITKMNIRHLGTVIESNAKPGVHNGPFKVIKGTFSVDSPVLILQNGPISIDGDVPEDELEAGLLGGVLNGPLICPNNLMKVLLRKQLVHNGPALIYQAGTTFLQGHIELDEAFAENAEYAEVYSISGKILALDANVIETLVKKKVQFHSEGTAYVIEDALNGFKEMQIAMPKIATIPKGTAYVNGNLVLDRLSFLRYGKSILVDGDLEILKESSFLSDMEYIYVSGTLTVPEEQLERAVVVTKYYNDLFIYEGSLMRIAGSGENLTEDMLTERLTLDIADSRFTIEESISPDLLKEKIISMTMSGTTVVCTRAQQAALRSAIKTSEGVTFQYHGEQIPEQESVRETGNEPSIISCAYLKL